jgi:ribosomal protein L7/L12
MEISLTNEAIALYEKHRHLFEDVPLEDFVSLAFEHHVQSVILDTRLRMEEELNRGVVLVKVGQMIPTIKTIRHFTRWGLKESKQLVDDIRQNDKPYQFEDNSATREQWDPFANELEDAGCTIQRAKTNPVEIAKIRAKYGL